MSWQLPFVSRRAYDILVAQLERLQVERDSYRDRGDRIYDETIMRFGYEAATPRVRQEVRAEAEEYDAALALEDPTDGMLDESIEETIDAAVTASETQRPS